MGEESSQVLLDYKPKIFDFDVAFDSIDLAEADTRFSWEFQVVVSCLYLYRLLGHPSLSFANKVTRLGIPARVVDECVVAGLVSLIFRCNDRAIRISFAWNMFRYEHTMHRRILFSPIAQRRAVAQCALEPHLLQVCKKY